MILVRRGTTMNDTCRDQDYYTTLKAVDNTSAGNVTLFEATTRRSSPISYNSPARLDDIAVKDCVLLYPEDGKSFPSYFRSCYTIYVLSIIDGVCFLITAAVLGFSIHLSSNMQPPSIT